LSAQRKTEYLAYLSLGSNIQPELNLPLAVELLSQHLQVVAHSTAWKTPAVGGHGPDFLNAVVFVRTKIPPGELKREVIEKIENQLGRVRTADKYAPRTIDIDILVVNGDVHDSEIWIQAHLAIPLAEICRDQIRSSSGETLDEISRQLSRTNLIEAQSGILQAQFFE